MYLVLTASPQIVFGWGRPAREVAWYFVGRIPLKLITLLSIGIVLDTIFRFHS